ncbi:hypothetical protein [Planctomicrobium sp. SH664]|uniref:hypothetical protein n=1 Tax=Planctomicrobium sp. SH664 TaxID=3448125 RepID=UPI003F5C4EA9
MQCVSIRDDWSRVNGEWLIVKQGRVSTYHIRHWIYSGQELRHLLESVGFKQVRIYGSMAGAAYGPGAQRLIAIAQRPV